MTDELIDLRGRVKLSAILNYFLRRRGPMATTGCDHGALLSTRGKHIQLNSSLYPLLYTECHLRCRASGTPGECGPLPKLSFSMQEPKSSQTCRCALCQLCLSQLMVSMRMLLFQKSKKLVTTGQAGGPCSSSTYSPSKIPLSTHNGLSSVGFLYIL